MAEDSPTGGERTEAPSSKRREDFRKKGQVAQSREVQTAALFTLTLLFWLMYMPTFWKGMLELLGRIFQNISSFHSTPAATITLGWFILQKSAILLAPLFLIVLLIGFFSSFLQFGWLFTTQPLTPDFSKLNPINGMQRFFSARSVTEVVKSLAKVGLISYIAFATVHSKFKEALVLVDTGIMVTLQYIASTAALILAKICMVLILLAAVDFFLVRREMEEKMKMTKQEQKEEFKETEGDPHVKAQIRSIQRQMARKRMMAEVPKADVVITNPTHFAVALRYDAQEMSAPIIIAKGADLVAMKIRELAKEHRIPIVENPPVARILHKLDLGASIPEDMFRAVAEILAHVYTLKGKIS